MKTTEKVAITFDCVQYSYKPKEIVGTIKWRMRPQAMTIPELADNCIHGTTFAPGVLKKDKNDKTKNGMNDDSWVQQRLFGLDIDEGMTIEEGIAKCKELNIMPVFMYTSFNHSDEHHKYRIVFCNNETLFDGDKCDKLQSILMKIFGYTDPHCVDRSRIFFGGKQLIYTDYEAEIDADAIIEKYKDIPVVVSKKKNSIGKIKSGQKLFLTVSNKDTSNHTAKIEAIKRLDVQAMRALLGFSVDEHNYDISEEDKTIVKLELTHRGLNDIDTFIYNLDEGLKDFVEMFQADTIYNMDKGYLDIDDKYQEIFPLTDLAYRYLIAPIKDKYDKNIKIILLFSYIYILDKVMENETQDERSLGGEIKLNTGITSPTKLEMASVNSNKTIFTSEDDLYAYIRKIDLHEFLGIPNSGKISCLFPEHEDNNPSAGVFMLEDETQVYHCFGCGVSRTILFLVQKLSGCNHRQAVEFIKVVYGLELQKSEFVQQAEENIKASLRVLDGDLSVNYPDTYTVSKTRLSDLRSILSYMLIHLSDNMKVDDQPYWFLSGKNINEIIDTKSQKRGTTSITLFCLLDMLEKMDESRIPKEVLNQAKTIKKKYGFKNYTNFFTVNAYGEELLEGSEKKAKVLRDHNTYLSTLNRDAVLRLFGQETADKVFPQYKSLNKQGTKKEADELTAEIGIAIMELIALQDYATFEDVCEKLKPYHKVEAIRRQFQNSLYEILQSYDLKYIQTNAETKAKYDVDTKGHNKSYPKIIVRNENKEEE